MKKQRRITPEDIRTLEPGEIFVFGSNMAGLHGGGAAALARKEFGAMMGEHYGLQGKSFAIPTKDAEAGMIGGTLKVPVIKVYVDAFIRYAEFRPGLKYLVTEIGCGLAGYSPEDVAPLFKDALHNESIWLPQRFIDVLERREKEVKRENAPLIVKLWNRLIFHLKGGYKIQRKGT